MRVSGGLSRRAAVIDWGMVRIVIEVLLCLAWAWVLTSFLRVWTCVLTANHLDDPVYKKNVQDLIERNRRFEKL